MANNLPTTRDLATQTERPDTDTYFSNLFRAPYVATTDQDTAIQSFFEEYINDKNSARLLTSAVILTSMAQNINPMSVLADFKKVNKGELTLYLSAFLNTNRVNSSLLGISNTPGVSVFVQRSILA